MSFRYLFLASLLLLCAVAATPAAAGVPSPSMCNVPDRLVVCPAGDATYAVTVRDIAAIPVHGSHVALHFDACPAFVVCEGCCPGLAVDPIARTVTAVSGANGIASFPLMMGPCPGAFVAVRADGIIIGTSMVVAFDQDGDLHVTATDAVIVAGLVGTPTVGADFDASGMVTQTDLDLLAEHGGHSCAGVVAVLPSTWGRLKTIYR